MSTNYRIFGALKVRVAGIVLYQHKLLYVCVITRKHYIKEWFRLSFVNTKHSSPQRALLYIWLCSEKDAHFGGTRTVDINCACIILFNSAVTHNNHGLTLSHENSNM